MNKNYILQMDHKYKDIMEELCLLQATLSIALLNYDYSTIEKTSMKIARYIKIILDENKIKVNK